MHLEDGKTAKLPIERLYIFPEEMEHLDCKFVTVPEMTVL